MRLLISDLSSKPPLCSLPPPAPPTALVSASAATASASHCTSVSFFFQVHAAFPYLLSSDLTPQMSGAQLFEVNRPCVDIGFLKVRGREDGVNTNRQKDKKLKRRHRFTNSGRREEQSSDLSSEASICTQPHRRHCSRSAT